jgi:hypothetical protein
VDGLQGLYFPTSVGWITAARPLHGRVILGGSLPLHLLRYSSLPSTPSPLPLPPPSTLSPLPSPLYPLPSTLSPLPSTLSPLPSPKKKRGFYSTSAACFDTPLLLSSSSLSLLSPHSVSWSYITEGAISFPTRRNCS